MYKYKMNIYIYIHIYLYILLSNRFQPRERSTLNSYSQRLNECMTRAAEHAHRINAPFSRMWRPMIARVEKTVCRTCMEQGKSSTPSLLLRAGGRDHKNCSPVFCVASPFLPHSCEGGMGLQNGRYKNNNGHCYLIAFNHVSGAL